MSTNNNNDLVGGVGSTLNPCVMAISVSKKYYDNKESKLLICGKYFSPHNVSHYNKSVSL